jgi:hypothetical protein
MTPKRKPGRPATGHNPVHCVRVPDTIWKTADQQAKANGTDLTALINSLLSWYIHTPGAKAVKRPPAPED